MPEASPDFLAHLFGAGVAAHIRDLPGVEEAVRSGSHRKIYSALSALRGKAGSGDLNEAIERAVSRRRAFSDPVAKGPRMYTLNGVGTRPYGRAEADPRDGTYVKTLYFTVVYLPVWPIASYLVADAGRSVWKFFGAVPLSRFHRLWRRALPSAFAAVVVWFALAAHAAGSKSDVRFVNGLDVAVTTTLGPETVRIPPGTTVTRTLASGRYRLVTKSPSNETIEELDVDVPRKTDLVAYNVLGAAPVVVEEVVYTTGSAPSGTSPAQQLLIGKPWIVKDGVEYVFIAPPQGLRLSMSQSRAVRHRAFVADGGWNESVQALAIGGNPEAAATLAARVALAERDERAVGFATSFALALGGDRLLAFGEQAVAAMPNSIEGHRARQMGLRDLGRTAEARATYKAAFERDPDSAAFGYLYGRLLPPSGELPILERLVLAHPEDKWIQRALGVTLCDISRFEDAVPHFERLASIDAAEAKLALPYRAAALAGAGRVPEAQRLVRSAIAFGDWALVIVGGRLARLPGADLHFSPTDDVVATAAGRKDDLGAERAEVAAHVRDAAQFGTFEEALRDANRLAAARIELQSCVDIAAAADAAASVSAAAFAGLDDAASLTVACELAATGRADVARKVYETNAYLRLELPRFEQLGAPAATLDDPDLDLDLEARAVLAVAASRRAKDPADRERYLASARAYDVLKYIVPR